MATTDIAAALGADIYLAPGDIAFTRTGDLQLVQQLDLISQRLFLCCLPDPNGILMHPATGAGLASTVQQPMSQHTSDVLAANVGQQVAQDPAVTTVQEVTIDMTSDPKEIDVTPVVQLVGGLTVQLPMPAVGALG